MSGESSLLGGLIAAALLLGLAGGVHCSAMCGGMCAAMGGNYPGGVLAPPNVRWGLQAGRVAAYTALGFVAGGLIQFVATASNWFAAVKPVWVLLHALMLVWGLCMVVFAKQPMLVDRAVSPIMHRVVWVRQSAWRSASVGLAWFIMPCGLLYSAVLLAGLSGGLWQGGVVMLSFAVPTVLWLMGVPWLFKVLRINGKLPQQWLHRSAGLLLAGTSAWALWRHAVFDLRLMC